jgi:hypothetical protein
MAAIILRISFLIIVSYALPIVYGCGNGCGAQGGGQGGGHCSGHGQLLIAFAQAFAALILANQHFTGSLSAQARVAVSVAVIHEVMSLRQSKP